ncbi:MAG: hypothetical protein RL754_67 [Bacteroidota bacterium]|jgi:D-3-phosphoglycerate dehydrogenase
MKALLLDYTHPFLEADLEAGGLELVRDFEHPFDAFPASHFDAEVLVIRSRMPIDADFLAAFSKLRVIGRLGAGLENIDLNVARERGITCLRVPEGNAQAVAEHALGLLLALMNHIPRAQREVRAGLWRREENKGLELFSAKVGIIGYGVMGSRFAEVLDAMGVEVLAHDKYKSGFATGNIRECTLKEIQEGCDVVSLHLPLTEETRYYADESFFNGFAKPVYFLNTARGPIASTEAMVEALNTGQLLGAGLDVLEYEKRSFTSLFDGHMPLPLQQLLDRDNVIITPHIAGWTKESFEKMGRGLATKILEAL